MSTPGQGPALLVDIRLTRALADFALIERTWSGGFEAAAELACLLVVARRSRPVAEEAGRLLDLLPDYAPHKPAPEGVDPARVSMFRACYALCADIRQRLRRRERILGVTPESEALTEACAAIRRATTPKS